MEHDETKHLERAPARGPARPAHGRSRPAAPLHTVRRNRGYPGAARGAQLAALRAPDWASMRNSRPFQRGPALPHGRAQPTRRHCHPLESLHLGKAVRQQKHAGLTVEPEVLAASHALGGLTSCPPRIPVAEAPIADLAYDSSPYRSRPNEVRKWHG